MRDWGEIFTMLKTKLDWELEYSMNSYSLTWKEQEPNRNLVKFSVEKVQKANKFTKDAQTGDKKKKTNTQIKTTLRYHFISTTLTKTRKLDGARCWQK